MLAPQSIKGICDDRPGRHAGTLFFLQIPRSVKIGLIIFLSYFHIIMMEISQGGA
ncbi:hypothetical protein ALO_02676 [Acetonema longum DSM 6540]|uniref:Uncharacterized protein n=1 Tax=Acetonema longum DSM 6540 TaxID=1009370 RepID=F7NES0_9FIRM|nr:hypothetical protein ALO_02676 [Acetonema longum DSM 6540]